MKKLKVVALTSVVLASLSISVFALSSTVQNITAQVRPDYLIRVNGDTQVFQDENGEVVHPIIYDGTTYLPIRAIGELMEKDVSWNGDTKTIDLNTVNDTTVDTEKPTAETKLAVYLPNANVREGNRCGSFTATTQGLTFTLTASGTAETYNVTLFAENGTQIEEHTYIMLDTGITFNDLTIGDGYYFEVSSYDTAQGGANARYTIELH